jgi:hypothetical protein
MAGSSRRHCTSFSSTSRERWVAARAGSSSSRAQVSKLPRAFCATSSAHRPADQRAREPAQTLLDGGVRGARAARRRER